MKETYTLYFDKTIHESAYHLVEENLTIADCKIYSIKNEETLIGQFFTGSNISFADFGEIKILIEEELKSFYRIQYYIRDYKSKKEVAHLHISGSIWFGKQSVSLSLPNQPSYRWKNTSSKVIRIFQPKTWSNFSTYLGNGLEEIIFKGKILYPTFSTKKVAQFPLRGEIKMNKKNNVLLLICGLYILEQEISLKDLD
jgi:hypothetical protein